MRRLRVRATPDPEHAPPAFQLLAGPSTIEETRLLEWNLGDNRRPTMLCSVDGEVDGLGERLLADPVVGDASVTPVNDGRAVLLLTVRPESTPLTAAVFRALTRTGLVVDLPVVYRGGSIHATFVGPAGALQSALEAFPPTVSVDVEEVGEFGADGPASGLSHRQREAVRAGLDLGYYDVPRAATHRDVAAALDCAPSTASEHLQKAEAKLVRSAMGQ